MNTKTAAKHETPLNEPEKNLPAEQTPGTALAIVDIDEEDRGAGLKNISMDERKIPFIRILQSNSPELEEGGTKYMPNAKAGLFLNTSTKALYPKLIAVFCARDHKFLEYTPRAIGGGFVGVHKPNDDLITALRAEQGKFGKLARNITQRDNTGQALNGTEIAESFELYSILLDPETNQKFRAIVSFQSTQIVKYLNVIDRSDSFEYQLADGTLVKPPIYAHKWVLTTGNEKNKKGSFKGYVIGLEAKKPDGSDDVPIKSFIKKSDPLYIAAKEFSKFVEAGQAEVDYSTAVPDAAPVETEVEM